MVYDQQDTILWPPRGERGILLGERNQRRRCSYTRALEPWEEWAHAEMRFRKEILTLEKERKEKHERQQEGQRVWEAWCFHHLKCPVPAGQCGPQVERAGEEESRGRTNSQAKSAQQTGGSPCSFLSKRGPRAWGKESCWAHCSARKERGHEFIGREAPIHWDFILQFS